MNKGTESKYRLHLEAVFYCSINFHAMIGEKEERILQQVLDLGPQSFYMKFVLDKRILREQEFKKTIKVLFDKLENGNFKK